MSELSRRGFLAALGSGAAGAFLVAADARSLMAAGEHAAHAARQATPPAFKALTPAQGADIEAFTAQIIPTDDTPGAREARVVYFIDQSFATFAKNDLPDFQKGYAKFTTRVKTMYPKAASFAALTSAQQIAVMKAMEKDKDPLFENLRGATIAGMFANPEYGGNHDKLGWKLIGFEDRFSWAEPFGYYDAKH